MPAERSSNRSSNLPSHLVSPGTTSENPARRIAVVGAGWAGLAAADFMAEQGYAVDVYESAPQAGGRARGLQFEVDGRTYNLDNGQHLIVGAYRECLGLIRRTARDGQLDSRPMNLNSVSGLSLRAPRLPAPLHLLAAAAGARGLSLASRWAMGRMMIYLRLRSWRTNAPTVADLLLQQRQPAALVTSVWWPLCIATLNTEPALACAQTFVNVLRDTLGGRQSDSDFVVTQASLSELFVDPLLERLARHGAQLHLRHTVRALERSEHRWFVQGERGRSQPFDQLVLALPPANSARLLVPLLGNPEKAVPNAQLSALIEALDTFEYEPIATVYLWWPSASVGRSDGRGEHRSACDDLGRQGSNGDQYDGSGKHHALNGSHRHDPIIPAWIQLNDSQPNRHPGQWLFDRGVQHGHRIASVVVSTAARVLGASAEFGNDRVHLGAAVADQVVDQLGLPAPMAYRTVIEKRATIRCTPGRPRLAHDSAQGVLDGLWLAGDYAWPQYPATLEGAVRSGLAAAKACLQSSGNGSRATV